MEIRSKCVYTLETFKPGEVFKHEDALFMRVLSSYTPTNLVAGVNLATGVQCVFARDEKATPVKGYFQAAE